MKLCADKEPMSWQFNDLQRGKSNILDHEHQFVNYFHEKCL
jgi:hypothetical protein